MIPSGLYFPMGRHITSIKLNSETYPSDSHYPFSLPLFSAICRVDFHSPATFFVGENGTGKSTLLEAIARACDIHIWSGEEGARLKGNPFEKLLYRYLSVNWTDGPVPGSYFGSESFNNFRQVVDAWAAADPGQLKHFGGESLVTQSHGQSIMSFFESRYSIKGLYLLDEPETALSPKSQLRLLEIIQNSIRLGLSQFIIATHSPILMALKGAQIYHFDNQKVEPVQYKDTEHYQIYKGFLMDQ